jgi:DNA-binding response OmpR family regulator
LAFKLLLLDPQLNPKFEKNPNMSEESTAANARKILLVDDNAVIQMTVSHALKKAGYQVFTAGDISKTLSTVRREKPDLILLDLTFPLDASDVGGPVQDGFFVIEWLRRAPEAEKIPIIIVSATDPAKYKSQISARGIVACFHKPLNHDELLLAIRNTLGGNALAENPKQP